MVIGTDAHYLRASDRSIHKSFLNSKDGEREVDSFYHDAHLMSDEEAFENLKDIFSYEEFLELCENSNEIYSKIEEYQLFHNPIIPEVKVNPAYIEIPEQLKDYDVLTSLLTSSNEQEREWVNNCWDSLVEKNIVDKTHIERLELEADIIRTISDKLGNCLFAYFNTFKHYIDLFWDCGSVVGPGRGSAGSFLSNYLLGITQLDPIEWNFPYFRFLNKERAELPDIDIDLAPSKRPAILREIRKERGMLNVVQVATFGTTSAKAAITTACRGYRDDDNPDGIDVDIATYLSSLVPIERGISWSLTECFYGNEEKNRKPIKELINQVEQYPGLKEIAFGIEDLVVRRGQHASGVILYNNSPYDTTALMRSPNGDITTQFDLHKSESLGDVKFDFLVTDICDKISITLQLLQENGYFPKTMSFREIYNQNLHPAILDTNDPKIWEALISGDIQDVFQFNTAIGIQTVQTIKPTSPAQLTAANALMRLAAPEGEERPFDRYVRFKNDINLWYQEMDNFGLTKEEQAILEPYYKRDYGVPASQEQLMLMVMDENISHFTLAESNNTRKVLAKKKVKEIPVIKEKFISQCPSKTLGEYAWKTMMLPQMSYSFSEVHSTLYSFIGIQTLVLATKYPIIYWNTACLIVNAQSIEEDDNEDEWDVYNGNELIDNCDEENDEDNEDEEDSDKTTKKKKQKTVNYGKVSAAIGKMKQANIIVTPPDINLSGFTFSPDEKNNVIRFGLRGITKIGEDIVKEIIFNRPYSSIDDFLSKNKINKPQMINLIKCGAFDSFCKEGESRVDLMHSYIESISEPKKRVTLQNMRMLIDFNLIPPELDFQKRLFNFNKYLKAFKDGIYYNLDNVAFNFYSQNFDIDLLKTADSESGFKISQNTWDSIYKKKMDKMREYIKANHDFLLNSINNKLINDLWDKYCLGSISKWEMDSASCYFHNHELYNIKNSTYEIADFFKLPEEPIVERYFTTKEKKQIPLFKICRIAGTVLDKDKTRKTVTLLTNTGVVTVKINGGVFANYDKQISERDSDGKKHVIEKSVFSRGNKIIVTGIRRDNLFVAKKYKSTPYHLIEQITEIDDNGYITTYSRNN